MSIVVVFVESLLKHSQQDDGQPEPDSEARPWNGGKLPTDSQSQRTLAGTPAEPVRTLERLFSS